MTNSRTKGANGERELRPHFQKKLGLYLVRNLNQSRSGGYDCSIRTNDCADSPIAIPFAIEIKRDEKMTAAKMWKQACGQVTQDAFIPIVLYRRNRKPWFVIHSPELIRQGLHIPKTVVDYSKVEDYDSVLEYRLNSVFWEMCHKFI
jgi:hypothetical protein